jgi:hypothetical protein
MGPTPNSTPRPCGTRTTPTTDGRRTMDSPDGEVIIEVTPVRSSPAEFPGLEFAAQAAFAVEEARQQVLHHRSDEG